MWRILGTIIASTVFICGLSAQDVVPCFRAGTMMPGSTSPGYHELEDDYDVIFYHLDLEMNDTTAFISGSTHISVRSEKELDTLVFELGNNKTVDSVLVDGAAQNFIHENDLLFIILDEGESAEEIIPIEVYYRGGSGSTGFFGGMNSGQDPLYGISATYSLSEPFEAKDWFPCKQNLLDKADSVWVYITVDTSLMAGSNGLLTRITNLPGGKHRFEWKSRYPIAFYLISVAVSDYIDYQIYAQDIPSGDSLLIQNFVYDHPDMPGNVKKEIDETVDMIEYFSRIFGTYPFYLEKYGHSMAPMGGGMEHQTMTTLRNFNFELVAHELAHQWFGDHVTCASWRDIWINEGFASYSEYLALEHLRGKNEAINWMTRAHDYAVRKPEGSIYLNEKEAKDIYRIFDYALSYKKGAAILHMLRYELNDDSLFFNILKEYRMEFADSVATGADFNHWVNRVSGRDFDWFFDQWYYGKGFPVVQTFWRQIANNLILETYQFPSSNEPSIFQTHLDYLMVYEDGSSELKKVWFDSTYRRYVFPVQGQVKNIESDPNRNVLMSSSVMSYFPRYNNFEVNPNPFSDRLNIVFNSENNLKKIYLTDSSGKILYRNETKNRNLDLKLDFLENGIYILVIMEEGRKEAVRVVKMKP